MDVSMNDSMDEWMNKLKDEWVDRCWPDPMLSTLHALYCFSHTNSIKEGIFPFYSQGV